MVLTKSELIASLQKEVRILVHLAGKLDRATADYRPTPKQRSALELLQYMSIMGPQIVQAAKAGGFDGAVWGAAQKEAAERNFDQTVAAIAAQSDLYAKMIGDMSDADFRAEITGFDGINVSKGSFIVNLVLSGHAAYRTQLFVYLKACGREELGTTNLWAGVDAPAAAV
jgi:hypothetical protein